MGDKKFSLEKPYLILVEGKDEDELFPLLAAGLGIDDVQFHCYRGGRNLQNVLPVIASLPEFSSLKGLGIEGDAEDSADDAFRSVSNLISRCNESNGTRLANPSQPCLAAGSDPRVVVWITPRGADRGSIEDIALRSIANHNQLECIERFIECAQACPGQSVHHLPSKPRVYSYIAIQRNPRFDLARAFHNNYFDLEHGAFDELREFLRMVCGR